MDWDSIRASLQLFNQEHVLKWLDELTESEQRILYNDLLDINFERLQKHLKDAQQSLLDSSEKKDDRLIQLDQSICASTMNDEEDCNVWFSEGLEAISKGLVAVLLLAGGQGTRLGVPYPKGMYDVGLPSKKTLYQLQAERILRLQTLAKERFGTEAIIPWYIMTSEYTRITTVKFFSSHNYFGLDPQNVIVFEQNTLPCVDYNGRILLDQKYHIARAPDGNGGLYDALVNPNNNMLQDMKRRGIECIHVYGVDNILVKMADPVFVGYCRNRQADCGAKVVRKCSPNEKVGVVCLLDGKYQVVEYSEISLHTSELRNPDGSLVFSAGNICNHFFTVSFLEEVCLQHKGDLIHHVANKKIPYIHENGERIEPTVLNGMKMEKFVFDVFQFTKKFVVLEVQRKEEFAPLKNGHEVLTDSPITVRQSLMDLHYQYLTSAGGTLVDENGRPVPLVNGPVSNVVCEISPLVTYSGEGLKKLCKDKTFKQPLHMQ